MPVRKFFIEHDGMGPWPRFYGVLWYVNARRSCLFCPMPFNLILRVLRAFWLWLRWPFRVFDSCFLAQYLQREVSRLNNECAGLQERLAWREHQLKCTLDRLSQLPADHDAPEQEPTDDQS